MSSTAMIDEEPPLKKNRLPTSTPSLPKDLLVSCLARVSRMYYPTLSLVSKSFRSLLTSPELYQTRLLLDRTEICLYVCLQFYPDPNLRWFTLCQRPHGPIPKNKNGYVLAKMSIPDTPPLHWLSLVSVGSNIYNIGGTYDAPSSSVSMLDCHSQTWHEAPSMQVERNYPASNAFDGKIYVGGGCEDSNSSNWLEVFDPKMQAWKSVLSPLAERCKSQIICKSAVIEGKIYMFGDKGVVYMPNEDKWEAIAGRTYLDRGWEFPYCVIDNVLYCYDDSNGIEWYDTKVHSWKIVKGLPKFGHHNACIRLANYGGKMAILWDKSLPYSGGAYKEKIIACAEITLETTKGDEILGKVEWFDGVLKVPDSYDFVKVIAATL